MMDDDYEMGGMGRRGFGPRITTRNTTVMSPYTNDNKMANLAEVAFSTLPSFKSRIYSARQLLIK